MNVVFAGTPAFSVQALEALNAAGHHIVGVYTQPDRPAGRGRKMTASPVAHCAETLGLPIFKPERLHAEAQEQLASLQPDVMVVVAYGLILSQAALDIPRLGCLNIHASLLPRWRGAAPIQRAIEAGDAETGITIMQMDAGLDTGPMLLRESLPINSQTTAASLHDELASLGAGMIVKALQQLEAGTLQATPQPPEGATYARKLDKLEARIDWQQPAAVIARKIRAFNPAPGAWTELDGQRVRLLMADTVESTESIAAPGQILRAGDAGIIVACGDRRSVRVETLQWAGGRAVSAAEASRARTLVQLRFD